MQKMLLHCIRKHPLISSRLINADLFNIQTCNYIEAVTDRLKIWLDNSRIRLDVQRELNLLPIDIFSGTKKSSGDLLGATATERLTQEMESRKSRLPPGSTLCVSYEKLILRFQALSGTKTET